jgi:hypothetical protein
VTDKDYPPQNGLWTLYAPDGRFWIGMTPLAACRAEQEERTPAAVRLARIMAAVDEPDPEVAALQARCAALEEALHECHALSIAWAAHYQYTQDMQDWHPTHKDIIDKAGALLKTAPPDAPAEGAKE